MAGISELPTVFMRPKQVPAWADDVVVEDGNLMVQDAPRSSGGIASLPLTADIQGQHHVLSYLTPEEQQLLRDAGGGLGLDGAQIYGPGGVPAFPSGGDDSNENASDGPADSSDGESANDAAAGAEGSNAANSSGVSSNAEAEGGFGGFGSSESVNDAVAGAEGSNAANSSGVSSNAEAEGGFGGFMAGVARAIGNLVGRPGVDPRSASPSMAALSSIAETIGFGLADAFGQERTTEAPSTNDQDNSGFEPVGSAGTTNSSSAGIAGLMEGASAGTTNSSSAGVAGLMEGASAGSRRAPTSSADVMRELVRQYGSGDPNGDGADQFLYTLLSAPAHRDYLMRQSGGSDGFWSDVKGTMSAFGREPNDPDNFGGGGGSATPNPTGDPPASWNEEAFLAANPDVAALVAQGDYPSGYSFDQAFRRFTGAGWADRATARRDPRWSPDVWEQFRDRNGRRQAVDVNPYYYG